MITEEQRKRIHDVEKQAMVGNQMAVLALVGAFRIYRTEVEKLSELRYSGGGLVEGAVSSFFNTIDKTLSNFGE